MNQLLFRNARLCLDACMHLQPGEEVLVLCDDTAEPELVQAYAAAAAAAGGEPAVMSYRPTRFVSMHVFGHFAAASLSDDVDRLPRAALEALRAADVAIIINGDLEPLFDRRFLEVVRGDTRVGWLPYLDADTALRLLPASAEEIRELHATTTRVGEAIAGEHDVTVTSTAGTDLRLRIGEHRVNWSSGVHEEGKGYGGLEIWPSGQISTVPNQATAEGTLVIDRSITVPEFKELLDPIIFTVEAGRVAKVEGGVEAARLQAFLEDCAHPDVFNLTELGVGTNSRCTAAGRAGPAEDTHTKGCVSFALGADVHLGGTVRAPIHLDMTMRQASLTVDGRSLVECGRLTE
jgi:2,5-dihydroxypyridine 5,6-dioxygenase